MADVQRQLSALLGRKVGRIRKTNDTPARVSVVDTIAVSTGKNANHSAEAMRDLGNRYPEVNGGIVHLKFPGERQRNTPVADARGIVEVIMLLPGAQAARIRRQAAELLVRYLGGDLSLVDEVCAIRGFQEVLAASRPEDPRRVFGEAVEATDGTVGSATTTQLARACTEAIANAVPGIIERLSAHIDERLAQDRQRRKLNVRAPKRGAPHQQQITRSLAGVGRPYPVAKFLDSKGLEDPSRKCARRSFAPAFSMQVQVPKKRKLEEEGAAAVDIEQNHRPQLLCTEEVCGLMAIATTPVQAPSAKLDGMERVLNFVVRYCKGDGLTSKKVNRKIRNWNLIKCCGRRCSEVVEEVLDLLVKEGLAEDVPSGRSHEKGRRVRRCRWKAWTDIHRQPGSDK